MTMWLVSTTKTQGQRKSDFCNIEDGELLALPALECDRDKDNVDGSCGCRRSMMSINGTGATTTMLVMDVPYTREQLIAMYEAMLDRTGWKKLLKDEPFEFIKWVRQDVDGIIETAEFFGELYVIEKRGDEFVSRGYFAKDIDKEQSNDSDKR